MILPIAMTTELCYTGSAKVKRNRARDFYFPHPIPNQFNNPVGRKKRLLSFCGSRRRLALATKRGKVGAFSVMAKSTEFYVYLLVRPDGRVFYVGKGSRYRMNQHEGEARTECRCRKCNTIRKIWREGGEVEKRIVFETTDEQEAYDYEADLITHYGRENLTNKSDGGETPRNYSSEGRARIGEAAKKRVYTPEMLRRKSEAQKGKKHTPEAIEKIRASKIGKPRSEETRKKLAIASKGRITPEVRARGIEANTGSRRSNESRAKMSEIAKSRSETWEKNRQRSMAAYRERHEREMFELIGEFLRQNIPAKEIIKQTGLSQTTFYRW